MQAPDLKERATEVNKLWTGVVASLPFGDDRAGTPQPRTEEAAALQRGGESQVSSPSEKEEMSIKELLSEYGVIALLFHFTVWVGTLLSVYALLTFGLGAYLPDWLVGGEGSAGAAAGRLAATAGIVEVVGPARLALTVAVTPRISERAREFAAVRALEGAVETGVSKATDAWARITSASPESRNDDGADTS
jgi:hypothetical protein